MVNWLLATLRMLACSQPSKTTYVFTNSVRGHKDKDGKSQAMQPGPSGNVCIYLCLLPFAQKAATEAKVPRTGERVLDLATGTGLVALDAAHRVGPQGSVLGVDLTTAMLAKVHPLLTSSPPVCRCT